MNSSFALNAVSVKSTSRSLRRIVRAPLVASALALGIAAGFGGLVAAPTALAQSAPQRGLPDFTELVEQVGPSVVNIRTSERVSARNRAFGGTEEEMQEFFKRFFGERVPMPAPSPRGQAPRPNAPSQPEERQRGVGSGFITSGDGFIMTNAHVVRGADEVTVTLTDKREFKARVIGADDRTDVAVLKIDATGLPAVKVGNVDKLKVGEWVMAIGSPYGLSNSVTAGIVSAKGRDTGELLPFIQTDVAINPGNSGGPLLNMRGEVVGINSQIYTESGGSMGISFAIPMDEAQRVADQLRNGGKVQRGRLGVELSEVTKEVAESIGLGKAQGAFVRRVEAGTPAEKAGIEAGDIITRFDGKVIEKFIDLSRAVANTKPGSVSSLTVFRKGGTKDLKITVGEMAPPVVATVKPGASTPAVPKAASSNETLKALGLSVTELSEKQKGELKIKAGVRVEAAEGRGARAGLRAEDAIVSINNTDVTNVKELEAALEKADKSKGINLLFRRGEWAQYTVIAPAAK